MIDTMWLAMCTAPNALYRIVVPNRCPESSDKTNVMLSRVCILSGENVNNGVNHY